MPFPIFVLLLFIAGFSTAQECRFADSEALRAYLHHDPNRAQPLIMAHRGGPAAGYPENTVATFSNTAKQVPCALIEFDVRMTEDSMLVLMHDNNLAVGTNGEGKLNKKTWEEVRYLRLKDVDGKSSSYTMNTLEEALRWAKEQDVILVIDAKPGTDIRRVASEIDSRGLSNKSIIVLYNINDAKKIHEQVPDLTMALGIKNASVAEEIAGSGLPTSHLIGLAPRIRKKGIPEDYYPTVHKYGISCSYNTQGNIDNLSMTEAASLYKARVAEGADIICTARPDEVYGVFYK